MNTKLKDRRMRKQISQEKAAEIIGVSLRSLRRYENGKSTPLLHSARNLALLYGCSIEELFFPDEEGGKTE